MAGYSKGVGDGLHGTGLLKVGKNGRPKRFVSFVAGTLGRKGERGPAIVDVGVEATSEEDAADLARVIADVPIAIEMRLNLQQHRPAVVLVTLGKDDAEGG
jgi:hypothetical protein